MDHFISESNNQYFIYQIYTKFKFKFPKCRLMFDPDASVNTDCLILKVWDHPMEGPEVSQNNLSQNNLSQNNLSQSLQPEDQDERKRDRSDLTTRIVMHDKLHVDNMMTSPSDLKNVPTPGLQTQHSCNFGSPATLSNENSTSTNITVPYSLGGYLPGSCSHQGVYLRDIIRSSTISSKGSSSVLQSLSSRCEDDRMGDTPMKERNLRFLSLQTITRIARGVALGCQYLHKKGVRSFI